MTARMCLRSVPATVAAPGVPFLGAGLEIAHDEVAVAVLVVLPGDDEAAPGEC